MLNDQTDGVAVIDDDPAILDSLKLLLEVEGYRVKTYLSAAAFLGDRGVRPACLILDHHMPQMTGLELAEQLRKEGTAVPVLLITGSSSPAILTRAAALGVEKVIEKPLREEDLMHFVSGHG